MPNPRELTLFCRICDSRELASQLLADLGVFDELDPLQRDGRIVDHSSQARRGHILNVANLQILATRHQARGVEGKPSLDRHAAPLLVASNKIDEIVIISRVVGIDGPFNRVLRTAVQGEFPRHDAGSIILKYSARLNNENVVQGHKPQAKILLGKKNGRV